MVKFKIGAIRITLYLGLVESLYLFYLLLSCSFTCLVSWLLDIYMEYLGINILSIASLIKLLSLSIFENDRAVTQSVHKS